MVSHEDYMQYTLDLAARGWPRVAPNPMVAAVIVCDGQIVAEGFHSGFGGAHAEVEAIRKLKPEHRPEDCELYVSLEPCSHYGKTPPCADLIIQKGFKKLYVATLDPNPLVSGKGIEKLNAAGIKTELGILEEKARWLNRRFFTFFEKQRPFYILKWAQTADGFISRLPIPQNRAENRISGEKAHLFAHQLRAESMAILVGKNTVLNDNPQLSTRLVEGRNPIRLFIDRHLEVTRDFKICDTSAETVIFNGDKEGKEGNLLFKRLNFDMNVLDQMNLVLYQMNIQSVLVEGGTRLLNDFIQQNLFDEICVIENPVLNFGRGIKAPLMNLSGIFESLGQLEIVPVYWISDGPQTIFTGFDS